MRILNFECRMSNFIVALVLFAGGCAKEQQGKVTPTPARVVLTGQRQAVMQTAEDVLAGMHFTIDKADPNSGLIKTRPLPAAQFFELWRSDNVGRFNSAEANLHSVRRTVELRITPDGNDISVACTAKAERLSLPEAEVSSSSRAYKMFSRSSSSLQKIRLNPQQQAGMAWVDLGEDKQLAAEIINRIEAALKESLVDSR
jgi:hypothetical protein